ncbi:DNA repair protein [Oceaniglobus ichthyenteri]|uniref:DNA repair protein n=1 Tax=Oceaniglobus ichthyenteri TaxID=2136177 RepID=UPI000F849C3A|nr:DNA repair protein [Oceaniglobus ichthyenteri]
MGDVRMEKLTPRPILGVGALVQMVAMAAIAVLAGLMGGLTLLSLSGLSPWFELEASFGGAPIPWAGMALQIGFTLFCIGLCFFLPASRRILKLEAAHRAFHINMEDVARAYRVSHAADRAGLFKAASEFDSVRERINHLRSHPDLGALEPDVMEVAAQMSRESRELARIYSKDAVDRAREFLRQRQEEAARMEDIIRMARENCDQLRHWLLEVQTEEALVKRHLVRLEADLLEMLPQLGFETSIEDKGNDTVIPLNRRIGEQAQRLMSNPQKIDN